MLLVRESLLLLAVAGMALFVLLILATLFTDDVDDERDTGFIDDNDDPNPTLSPKGSSLLDSELETTSIFSATAPPKGDELADTPLPPPVSDPEPDNFFSFFLARSPRSPILAGEGVMVVSVKLAVVNFEDSPASEVELLLAAVAEAGEEVNDVYGEEPPGDDADDTFGFKSLLPCNITIYTIITWYTLTH